MYRTVLGYECLMIYVLYNNNFLNIPKKKPKTKKQQNFLKSICKYFLLYKYDDIDLFYILIHRKNKLKSLKNNDYLDKLISCHLNGTNVVL